MDTKLKNIKYALGAKAAAVVLVWLCFLGSVGSGAFLLFNNQTITRENYYDTYNVMSEFARLAHNVVELNVKLKNEESIRASGAEEKVIANNLDRLYRIKDRLSNTVNFLYYIKDSETGEAAGNITAADPEAFIGKQPVHIYVNQWSIKSDYSMYMNEIREMLRGTNYEVYAAIQEPLKEGDVFYDAFMRYSRVQTLTAYARTILAVSVVFMAIVSVYLAYVAGRREKDGEIVYSYVDGIFTDVHTILVLLAAYLSMRMVIDIYYGRDILSLIIFLIILSIDAFIGISYVLSMIRQIKGGRLLRNTLALLVFKRLKEIVRLCVNGKLFRPSVLLILLAYGMVNGLPLGAAIVYNNEELMVLLCCIFLVGFNISVIYFFGKTLLSLSQIMEAAKEISAGNLDYKLNSAKISMMFSGFAENIEKIQEGLKKSVAEAVKGERMKTDLIANVSHDLKTPLTSIVSYVDLLRKEDLKNEKADGYVRILEEKSARLKQLIEDLVEASKASSGNLAVNAEKVDLHELIMQACGEYEEKIERAGLDIRINADEKKTFVHADGKHMWRIVENLFSNAVKYSMPCSRLYVYITKNDECGILTIKNISASPLDIPPEQLTERFVRGDTSRNTEGSGLGLSIAQSLTALQGGRFEIQIDGDLFKVTVEIPLYVSR